MKNIFVKAQVVNMHFSIKTLVALAMAALPAAQAAPATSPQTTTPPAPTDFSPTIQNAIVSFQQQVLNVIKDYAQNADQQTTTTDYSSTGRALDFYLRNYFLPNGPTTCPQAVAGAALPPQAQTTDAGIAYLQQAQQALSAVSQDAINGQFEQGVYDFCQAIRLYGGAARSY